MEKVTKQELNKMEADDTIALSKAEQLIAKGMLKTVFLGKDCFFKHPSVDQDTELKRREAILFSDLITKENLLCSHQIMKIIEQKGIWTKENKDKDEELYKSTMEYFTEFASVPYEKRENNPEFDKALGLYIVTCEEWRNNRQTLDSMLSSSIESIISQKLLPLKVSMCVIDEEEKSIFTEDEIKNRSVDKMLLKDLDKIKHFWNGVEDRFLGK